MLSIEIFIFFSPDLNYDSGVSTKSTINPEDYEFEPVTALSVQNVSAKNINCDDFSKYALNCTLEAALIYNSSRMAPPYPSKISDWCG